MKKNRILHISTWKTPCGIATYCDNLVKALGESGSVEGDVFPLSPSEWPDFIPNDIADWKSKILRKAADFELVHIQHEHGLFGYSQGQKFACKRYGELLSGFCDLGIPTVTTFHTEIAIRKGRGILESIRNFQKKLMWDRFVVRHYRANPHSVRAIVHSTKSRKSFVKVGFPNSSISVLNHPCLLPKSYTITNAEAKSTLGLDKTAKLATIFGFVGSYKGHDFAIAAMKKLPSNYHLAIVGGNHPEARDGFLNDMLGNLPPKLRSRIRVTGWVDRDTANLYYAATDVCLAPYRESELSGSGAVTWALSSGKPVIASKIDAFQRINRQCEGILMTTPECVSELAWAIERVTSDFSLGSRLVSNATRYCLENSWEASVEKFIELYRQVGLKITPELQGAMELRVHKAA